MPESGGAVGNVVQNKILTEMAMGFSRSRVLCAAARLGVADALGDKERSLSELADSCKSRPDSLYRLLRALASFGIVTECAPQHFALTALGNSLERDGVASRWSKDPNASSIFRAVMGTAPAEDYMSIVRAWDFSPYRMVADLGGGGGALIEGVLQAYPRLRGMLVDHQESIEAARPRFEAHRLTERCQLVAADLSSSVPAGADIYMMKHVLHGCDDQRATEILRHCRSVLNEGRLLIIEFLLPDVVDRADPELESRFMSDLNMLAVTGGKERSALEWKRLLANAGLSCCQIIPVPGNLVSIIEAARIA